MMKQKILILAVLSLAVLFGLAAEWQRLRPSRIVAVIPETTAQELWEGEHAGASHAAHKNGWKVYWNGPSRIEDFPGQVQIVRRVISRKVLALVLSPDHDVVLISAVREALAHNIPTVIVGTPLAISPGNGLSYVLNDDHAGGRMAAEYAVHFLKPGDGVLVLGINPNLLGSVEMADSFEACLSQLMPGVRIEERHGTSDSAAEAEEYTEQRLRADPKMRLVLALNVEQSRAGYAALMNAKAQNRAHLIGYGQDLDLLHHLRYGGMDAVIAQDTNQMGEIAINNVAQQLQHLTYSNLRYVAPVLVTRQNVDDSEVQRVLSMDWRVQP